MNIVVTGSLGNISRPLTQQLVQDGHAVTVISSSPEKQQDIETIGAAAAIGKLEDADFLSKTFTGADAVYLMVPPNFGVPDMRAYYRSIGNVYVQALQQSGVKRAVHLSSWGADLDEGTGVILGSHDVEGLLNGLPGEVAITHLRAGSIHYNLYNFIGMIKGAGFIGANYGGEDRIVWVAPTDIAAAAAEELARLTTGKSVRYIASEELTAAESARILGTAIGKPDLQWITFTDEQARQGMEQSGVPPHIAADLTELNAAIHSGAMWKGYEQHKPAVMGKVKLTDFSKEFAAKYADV